MMAAIFIEPTERYEALQAYKDKLTDEQIEQIADAPDGAIVRLEFGIGEAGTRVTIIPEG